MTTQNSPEYVYRHTIVIEGKRLFATQNNTIIHNKPELPRDYYFRCSNRVVDCFNRGLTRIWFV